MIFLGVSLQPFGSICTRTTIADAFGQSPPLPVSGPPFLMVDYHFIGHVCWRTWICRQCIPMISPKILGFFVQSTCLLLKMAKHTIFSQVFVPTFWTVGCRLGRSPDLDAVAVHAGLQGLLAARRLREAQEWQQRMQQLGLRQLELLGKDGSGSLEDRDGVSFWEDDVFDFSQLNWWFTRCIFCDRMVQTPH